MMPVLACNRPGQLYFIYSNDNTIFTPIWEQQSGGGIVNKLEKKKKKEPSFFQLKIV